MRVTETVCVRATICVRDGVCVSTLPGCLLVWLICLSLPWCLVPSFLLRDDGQSTSVMKASAEGQTMFANHDTSQSVRLAWLTTKAVTIPVSQYFFVHGKQNADSL